MRRTFPTRARKNRITPKTLMRYNMRMPAPKLYDPARFLPEIHAWIESGKTYAHIVGKKESLPIQRFTTG